MQKSGIMHKSRRLEFSSQGQIYRKHFLNPVDIWNQALIVDSTPPLPARFCWKINMHIRDPQSPDRFL